MRTLCSGTLSFWMPVPLARSVGNRIPLDRTRRDGLRPVVPGRRMLPISSNAGSKRPWAHQLKRGFEAALGWPYSGPRAARITGVNAGESQGPCRRSCRAR